MFTYHTQGTCSVSIDLEIEEGIIRSCAFERGCAGNPQGLAKLVIGMPVDEVIERLKGIQCRNGTSCPDQLSRALEQWKARQAG
jgi:uncharacterized protein (TIGR03905 family)